MSCAALEVTTQLTLTPEESALLIHHLTQRIEHLDAELVHTDRRDLQRALADELHALRALTDRIRSNASARVGDEGSRTSFDTTES